MKRVRIFGFHKIYGTQMKTFNINDTIKISNYIKYLERKGYENIRKEYDE